jgi:uncharacterized protein YbaR (Trm112 family)
LEFLLAQGFDLFVPWTKQAQPLRLGRFRRVAGVKRRLIQCLFTNLKALASLAETIMAIPKYALDILVCPICKTRVELLSDGSGLKCVTCRRVYPVRDDIPVMLPEEAKIAEE